MDSVVGDGSNNANTNNAASIEVEYKITKDSILRKIANIQSKIILITAVKDGLIQLKNNINDTYVNAQNYIQQLLNEQKSIYSLSSIDYNTRFSAISSNIFSSSADKAYLISIIPPISGTNITDTDVNTIINNIINAKNTYINKLTDDISKCDVKLTDYNSQKHSIDTEYQTYIVSCQ